LHYLKDGKSATAENIERMTFYWYPWTLAESYALAKDDTLSGADRKVAAKVFDTLASRHDDAIQQATSCCTYQLGEYMYCVGLTFRP
jgi:hypothetical protein